MGLIFPKAQGRTYCLAIHWVCTCTGIGNLTVKFWKLSEWIQVVFLHFKGSWLQENKYIVWVKTSTFCFVLHRPVHLCSSLSAFISSYSILHRSKIRFSRWDLKFFQSPLWLLQLLSKAIIHYFSSSSFLANFSHRIRIRPSQQDRCCKSICHQIITQTDLLTFSGSAHSRSPNWSRPTCPGLWPNSFQTKCDCSCCYWRSLRSANHHDDFRGDRYVLLLFIFLDVSLTIFHRTKWQTSKRGHRCKANHEYLINNH
jgi:hypothetical protein